MSIGTYNCPICGYDKPHSHFNKEIKNYMLYDRVKIFVDMDGVIVDFDGLLKESKLSPQELKVKEGAYLSMKPIMDSINGLKLLLIMGFNVYIATKPPTGVAHAYSEKAKWIFNHIPELSHKLIITSDKGLLGDEQDYLIDDRIHRGNCNLFKGTVIEFVEPMNWKKLITYFTKIDINKLIDKQTNRRN